MVRPLPCAGSKGKGKGTASSGGLVAPAFAAVAKRNSVAHQVRRSRPSGWVPRCSFLTLKHLYMGTFRDGEMGGWLLVGIRTNRDGMCYVLRTSFVVGQGLLR